MAGNKTKRKTLAFQITFLGDTYANMLWPGVADVAREKDYNLIIFTGGSYNSPQGYNYQQNVIYEFVNKNNVDAFVMTTGTLLSYVKMEEFNNYYNKFLKLPVVSINVKLEGIPSILIDNKFGMKETVNHLIKVHGLNKIAFIRGPENNPEAQVRYSAYLEALSENGIKTDPQLIVQGNFLSPSGYEAVETLVNKRKCLFDAIVSSNDEMALSAIEALTQRGIKIPDDVVVTGFDDAEMAQFSSPPLTTIRQPIYQQARLAAETVIAMLEGKKVPEEIILPTKLIVRSSCGCFSESVSMVKSRFQKIKQISYFNKNNIINDCKEKSALEIGRLLQEYPAEINRIINTLNGLFDVFQESDINKENSETFLKLFNNILKDELKAKRDIKMWQDILTIFFNQMHSVYNNFAKSLLLTPLSHKARIILSEMIELTQARKRLDLYLSHLLFRDFQQGLAASLDLEDMTKSLALELPKIGIKSCYLSLFGKELKHLKNEPWLIPENSTLIMAYNETGNIRITSKTRIKYSSKHLVPPEYLPSQARYTMIASSIYFREVQLGIILYELGTRDKSVYETLGIQIGAALKSALLFTERQSVQKKLVRVLNELEKSNEKLKTLSEKDELTGLYNRRGFLHLVEQNMNLVRRMKKQGMLLFIDIDGLKIINDTYGHKEGDRAIKETGRILGKSFRAMDIIGRIGGDEFVIFVMDADKKSYELIKERLYRAAEEFNSKSRKPYMVSFSIGTVPFSHSHMSSMENLISEADKNLYRNKRLKKRAKS